MEGDEDKAKNKDKDKNEHISKHLLPVNIPKLTGSF